MKRLLQWATCFLLLALSALQVNGQCTAGAGKDTSICVSFGLDTVYLGSSPTVTGGTPPFTYAWSCTYATGSLKYTASDFLDDTTAANPQLIDHNADTLAFYLTVTDSLGNACRDTAVLEFCQYGWTLEDKQAHIIQGDTAQIYPGIGQGCPPLQYQWTPNYNISDPAIPNPVVWPDTTTYYVLTVTDSVGCQAMDETFEVYVTPAGIKGDNQNQGRVRIFPNPVSDRSAISVASPGSNTLAIEFYDALGRTIKQLRLENHKSEIAGSDFGTGIYFYRVFDNNIPVQFGKLIIK